MMAFWKDKRFIILIVALIAIGVIVGITLSLTKKEGLTDPYWLSWSSQHLTKEPGSGRFLAVSAMPPWTYRRTATKIKDSDMIKLRTGEEFYNMLDAANFMADNLDYYHPHEILRMYHASLDNDGPEANYYLGMMYYTGAEGIVHQNMRRAKRYFEHYLSQVRDMTPETREKIIQTIMNINRQTLQTTGVNFRLADTIYPPMPQPNF